MELDRRVGEINNGAKQWLVEELWAEVDMAMAHLTFGSAEEHSDRSLAMFN